MVALRKRTVVSGGSSGQGQGVRAGLCGPACCCEDEKGKVAVGSAPSFLLSENALPKRIKQILSRTEAIEGVCN